MDLVAAHPQVRARGLLVEVDHAGGAVPVPTAPWRTGLPAERPPAGPPPAAPPLLGQHTAAVLQRLLDYSPERIAGLQAEGVIRCAPVAAQAIMKSGTRQQETPALEQHAAHEEHQGT
jgi:crotonobetainyl-CoA:carnitine CoA-transferase CaiB-like acyl-CoA transferase